MRYVLKNPLKLSLAVLVDIIGFFLFFPAKIFKRTAPQLPRNILVIRLDHIGDFVCLSPIFKNLKSAFGDAKITALVNSACQELAKANPYIDEVLVLDAPWLRKKKLIDCFAPLVAGLASTRKIKFDLGIEARGDFFSILIMFLAGVRYRLGYGITGGGFLLDKELRYERNAHAIDKNLGLLEAIPIAIIDRKPEIYFKDTDKFTVEALLDGIGKDCKKQIVLHPYAGTKAKEWKRERFAELIKALTEDEFSVLLIGSQADGPGYDNVCDLRGQLNLTQLTYLIKKAGLFAGLDSGPANMAMSLEVPSVVICSGTNLPELWLPSNPKGRLICKDASCKPCELTICKQKTHLCMDSITVKEVIDAVKGIK